jgi:hypothetical protein
MLLNKTALAREALQSGSSAGLGLRERRILILTDGRRTLNEVMSLLGSDILPTIDRLLREGYIADANASAAVPAPAANGVAGAFAGLLRATTEAVQARTGQLRAHNVQQAPGPASTTTSAPAPTPIGAQEAPRSGQRRSLVAAKMYMVDMLQLQRHPDAVELKARVQFASGQAELLDAILDGMRVLSQLTNASFGLRIVARLGEVLPEDCLPAFARAAATLRAPAPVGAPQLKVVV